LFYPVDVLRFHCAFELAAAHFARAGSKLERRILLGQLTRSRFLLFHVARGRLRVRREDQAFRVMIEQALTL
jgi:hypothetical protein